MDTSKLAILIIETERDKHLIPGLMENIRTSLFLQDPTFVVVSGEGQYSSLSKALNAAISQAASIDCKYLFWAHPDMEFHQPNWHLPLIEILDSKPSVLKICASNNRDAIGPLRLDQEQSWMMRTADYLKFDCLWFNEEFSRIGGFEDWFQSYSIISSGYLVLVTPKSRVFHKGMGTRKLRDTIQEQRDNSATYHKLTGMDDNPHQWKFFGCQLEPKEKEEAYQRLLNDFPEFKS